MKTTRAKRNAHRSGILILALLGIFWFWNSNKNSAFKPSIKAIKAKAIQQIASSNTATNAFGKQVPAATNGAAAGLSFSTNSTGYFSAKGDGQISDSALKQISALEVEKTRRTPIQQKIDTQLLYANKMTHGEAIAKGVATQRVDLDKDAQGRILVDIKANVTDELLQFIETGGGKIINSFPKYKAIRAGVPLASIENVAARTEVAFVRPAVRAMNNNVDSEGDYTHQANTARTSYGVNGSGVKIGVLSDSVDYLASSQIAGLVTVLSGQSGTGEGEGTAMLEIIHDLAPGAQLFFATGNGSEANFANNILELQASGCNIIVDDLLYDDEPPFQDGTVAKAVNTVTANGVLYFSSANNAGNKDNAKSGTWEGDFTDGGLAPSPMETSRIHNFTTGINANTCLGSGPGGSQLRADLFWSDPLGASTNDYDLYVLNSAGNTVIASSLNTQNGSQDPYESVGTITNGELIVIVKYAGAGRFLHLSTGRGLLSVSTQGSTRGHDCATNAFGVAAVNAYTPYPGSYDPYGPYPNAFTGGAANPVENFSSDGPRRVFFQANGTPITTGNFSSSGGVVRQKPDIAAANGVTTDVPDLAPFFGTSAAAPHAGAIAALLKSYNTNLTASQIRSVLTNTALDIMSSGVDRDSGAGIVMALAALGASPLPNLARFTDNLNNSSPHTGDVVTVSITITNQPCSNGGTAAGTFHVGFYFSASSSFAGATPFYEAAVSGCAANGATLLNQNITISSGTVPGIYYLGYKINDENEVNECNSGDNGIFYWTITVLPPPQPDLTKITDYLNNSSPHPGDTVSTSITITNGSCTGGSADAGTFHIGYYFSSSSSFSGATPFYEQQINGCAANTAVSTNLNITINSATTPGTYYLGYKINDENEVSECNSGNNGIFYWTLSVQSTNTTAQVTLATVPSGLLVSLDNGASVPTPVTTNWTSGTTHSISTFTGQLSIDNHTRYNYSSWSDGGAQSHSITPNVSGTYTAYFSKNYLLNTSASPLSGGVITNSPAGPWYNPGSVVQLTANRAGGYVVSSWTGVDSSSNNVASLTMNGYRSAIANFSVVTAPNFGGSSAISNKLITTLSGLLSGEQVILQVSTNLQTWNPIQTNSVNGSTLSLTNTINPSLKNQFYRATVQ
jgi:hypothetical protein